MSDERFQRAIAIVLDNEGDEFTNIPGDRGGATRFGVSIRFLQKLGEIDPEDGYLLGDMDHDGDIDILDIASMTVAEAVRIYRGQWWDRYGYDRISDDGVAFKTFDLAIVCGPGRAHRLLQEAVRDACWSGGCSIPVDGVLGPKTLHCVNECAVRINTLWQLKENAASYFHSLNQPQFIKGWLRRARA